MHVVYTFASKSNNNSLMCSFRPALFAVCSHQVIFEKYFFHNLCQLTVSLWEWESVCSSVVSKINVWIELFVKKQLKNGKDIFFYLSTFMIAETKKNGMTEYSLGVCLNEEARARLGRPAFYLYLLRYFPDNLQFLWRRNKKYTFHSTLASLLAHFFSVCEFDSKIMGDDHRRRVISTEIVPLSK